MLPVGSAAAGSNSPDIEQTIRLLTTGLQIVVTAFLTILTFIAGQIFMKFAEPAFKLREEIGAIAQDLEMYANEDERIANPEKRREIFRAHASKLHGILSMIVGYDKWQRLFRLPQRQNIEKACAELFRLSNMQVEPKGQRSVKGPYATGLRIRELLNSRPLTDGEKEYLSKTEIAPKSTPG
jgi:hypothetical protein